MKKHLLTSIVILTCVLSVYAQDCKMCGVWNGAFKDEFPSGEKYRVNIEFNIQSNKKFEYNIQPADFGSGHWVCSDEVFFVNEECNDRRIKFYVKGEDDDWEGEKFKGKVIGNCIIHTYTVLELSDKKNTLIYRRLGRDYFYYDTDGNYIGKEWKDGEEDSFVCILHQLED